MTKRELIAYLKREIPKLTTDYSKVYDAVTIEEGISDCFEVGKRRGYEFILWLLTNKNEGLGKEQKCRE